MERGPGVNEAPGEQVDFQGTCHPSSTMLYPGKQDTLINKGGRRPVWRNKKLLTKLINRKGIQEVEMGSGDPGGL